MSERERYITEILGRLLKKHYTREVRQGQSKRGRRIQMNIREVYPEYEKPDADMERKDLVNQAAAALRKMDYIDVLFLPYSDDMNKIYLNRERIGEIESYLEENFGILRLVHVSVYHTKQAGCEKRIKKV